MPGPHRVNGTVCMSKHGNDQVAYGGQAVTARVRSFARVAPRLQQGFGVVVIVFAALTYLQYDTLIVAWLTYFSPNGQIGL